MLAKRQTTGLLQTTGMFGQWMLWGAEKNCAQIPA
jgi:hypothetical protein